MWQAWNKSIYLDDETTLGWLGDQVAGSTSGYALLG